MRSPIRLLARVGGAAAARVAGGVIGVSTREPVAALTFDDGPDPIFTPRLLEVLAAHRTRATFFMIGAAARANPELVRRVADAGHVIGNHSWNHPSFPRVSARARRSQLRACQDALAPHGQRLFRPPYGHLNTRSQMDAMWMRYRVMLWNLDTRDWEDRDPGSIVTRVMSEIRPGSIILFHDGVFPGGNGLLATDRLPTLEAVSTILDRLDGTFSFVTAPELLTKGAWVHGRARSH